MSTGDVVIIVVVAVAVLAIAAFAWSEAQKARERTRLRQRFGPEYDRAVETTGDRRRAEGDLRARVQQRDQLQLRPLSPAQRDRYAQEWRYVQATFVDAPRDALTQADALITSAMADRGYPMEAFEQQADLVSVDHPEVVENFRQAHGVYVSSQVAPAPTEDMRRAFVSYRALFTELVETDDAPQPAPARSERVGTNAAGISPAGRVQ